MKTILKMCAALLLALVINVGAPRVFFVAIGHRLLASANWVQGTQPPTYYAMLSILVSAIAALIAGGVASRFVLQHRIVFALVCGALITAQTIVRFRSTLFPPLYLDAWPVTLAPVVGMPLGAWLLEKFQKSSARSASA